MQAIQDLELPCKFAEKGCTYVAARSTLREHIQDCPFDLRVECQHWICKETMSLEKLVDHLQEVHGCSKLQPRRDEIGMNYTKTLSSGSFCPSIAFSRGNTFFLNVRTDQGCNPIDILGTWSLQICSNLHPVFWQDSGPLQVNSQLSSSRE